MKAISIILYIFILPLAIFVLSSFSLKLTVLNANFIKKELKSEHAYQIIYNNFSEIGTQVVGGGEKDAGGVPAVHADNSNPFSQADTIAFAKNILTPQLMQKETESFIDSVWPWLFSGKKLVPVAAGGSKTSIYNGIMNQFKARYDALPVCAYPGQFNLSLKTCRLSGVSFDNFVKQIQMQNFGNTATPLFTVNNIPDNFDTSQVTPNNPKPNNNFQNISGIQSWLAPITKNFYFLPAILFIILVLLARLFAGAWKKMPIVLGVYLTILAGIFLALSLIANNLVLPWLLNFANQKITTLLNIKNQLIVPLAKDIIARVGGMDEIISFSIIGLGLTLIVGQLVLHKLFSRKAEVAG